MIQIQILIIVYNMSKRKLSITTEEENDGEKYKNIKSIIRKKCLKSDLILTTLQYH